MGHFFNNFLLRLFFLFEQKLSELLSVFALIDAFIINHKPISLPMNSTMLPTKGESSKFEMNTLHELANQTEHELKTAIDSNMERNDQLNILLDRSDLLLHKNQAFGIGVMDYRKNIEGKQALNRLKYIAIGILLLMVTVLVIVLNVVLNHTNNVSDRRTNIILE